jgi:hypothetical protein
VPSDAGSMAVPSSDQSGPWSYSGQNSTISTRADCPVSHRGNHE